MSHLNPVRPTWLQATRTTPGMCSGVIWQPGTSCASRSLMTKPNQTATRATPRSVLTGDMSHLNPVRPIWLQATRTASRMCSYAISPTVRRFVSRLLTTKTKQIAARSIRRSVLMASELRSSRTRRTWWAATTRTATPMCSFVISPTVQRHVCRSIVPRPKRSVATRSTRRSVLTASSSRSIPLRQTSLRVTRTSVPMCSFGISLPVRRCVSRLLMTKPKQTVTRSTRRSVLTAATSRSRPKRPTWLRTTRTAGRMYSFAISPKEQRHVCR